MTKDLYNLAMDVGMTEQEFIKEIDRLYSILLLATLEQNEVDMLVHTVIFTDHELEIITRRIPDENVTVN